MKVMLSALFLTALLSGCTTTTTPAAAPAGSTRSGVVSLKGAPLTLSGPSPQIDRLAPDFRVMTQNFTPVSLSEFRGRIVVISAVPSLDTPVCSMQTVKFSSEAAQLPENVVVLTISRDLPFAQKRVCAAESITRTMVLSDANYREFGDRYGISIVERGLLARSVWIIDPHGNLAYSQIVPELSAHPDYDTAISFVRTLTAKKW